MTDTAAPSTQSTPQAPSPPAHTVRRPRNWRRWIWIGSVTYITLVWISHGLEWKRFSHTMDRGTYPDDWSAEGPITGLRTAGFGSNRDYFFTVPGYDAVFMVPAQVSKLNLDGVIEEGKIASIRAFRGEKSVVIALWVKDKPEDSYRQVLNNDISKERYAQIVRQAGDQGTWQLIYAALFALIGFGAPLLGGRILRRSPRSS